MTNRYEDEARREIEHQEGFRRWMAERITTIHATASAADVLRRNGVKLRYGGKRPESIFCPFHGNTKSMAARFHPADARRPDHVWCFVCNEQWDCISLTKKFENYTGKFSGLLRIIERDYGITPPEAPPIVPDDEPDERELANVLLDLESCENLLRRGRRAFEMRGYLILGSVLDRVAYGINTGTMSLPTARENMQKVMAKIAEKVAACPDA